MRARLLAGAVTIAALVPACGPSGSGSFMEQTVADVKKAEKLTYVADRRFMDYVGSEAVELFERFHRSADGYRVQLLAVDGKQPLGMSAEEQAEFDRLNGLLQGGRGRFVAEMRDFEVRDDELFLGNYTWTVFEADAPQIAGRDVIGGEVKPLRTDRPWYRVWVDQETLVTLKYQEYLPSGVLATEMEVHSIEYDSDLSEVPLRTRSNGQSTELDGVEQIAAFVPFGAFVPTYLPEGFVLTSCRVTPNAHVGQVLSLTYADGIQELVITQYKQLGADESLPAGIPVKVGVTTYGPTVDADLVLLGTQIHVTAKVEDGEVMTVIEGLVHAEP